MNDSKEKYELLLSTIVFRTALKRGVRYRLLSDNVSEPLLKDVSLVVAGSKRFGSSGSDSGAEP